MKRALLWIGALATILLGTFALVFPHIDATADIETRDGHNDIQRQRDTSTTSTHRRLFYGMQYVDNEEFSTVKELGIDLVLKNFWRYETPAQWTAHLDEAQANGLRLVAWYWAPGWTFDGTTDTWTIDENARLFLETVQGHPALFAVYMLHESYWNGCFGCGYTTAQQQDLYRMIKEIADVPLYSALGEISFWHERGEETRFADGVCDYCDVWHYPFREGESGLTDRAGLRSLIETELNIVRTHAPNSKLIWVMQSFAFSEANIRMPTAEEMKALAELVYSTEVDGVWWYTWSFGNLYEDFLSNHPELYPTVREIYDLYVAHDGHKIYMPIIQN